MTSATRALSAVVAVAAIPVFLSAVLLRGRYLLRQRFIELDPFEIDRELFARNDAS